MFCPRCRAEYREGFIRCATCGVDLVEETDLPPDPDTDEDPEPLLEDPDSHSERGWTPEADVPPDAVQVFESLDPFLVTTVRELLQKNDIPFFSRTAEPGAGLPSAIFGCVGRQAVHPTEFLVLPEREAETRALLEDFLSSPSDESQILPDLPPELVNATDEPDPDPEEGSPEDSPDWAAARARLGGTPPVEGPDLEEPLFCPFCGAELTPTEGDRLASRHPCRACGKIVELPRSGVS